MRVSLSQSLRPRSFRPSCARTLHPQLWRLYSNGLAAPQNRIEKIVQNYAVEVDPSQRVQAGDYLSIRPHHVMTHDNTGPVISKFQSMSCSRIRNPRQPVFTLDHDVQNHSDTNMRKYRKIEEFAKQHGIDFYPAGRGIGHQIMVEEGYALPGRLVVASDSHSNHYGGVGCLGTAIVRTDAAGVWATGNFWWQIPRVVCVSLEGELGPGVTGKDVIVALAGLFNQDEVLNAAIEFRGTGISHLSIDERLTIANMTTEWGAVAGVFPIDDRLREWYASVLQKAEQRQTPMKHLNAKEVSAALSDESAPDSTAHYAATLTLDLSSLVPYVSGPNSVKKATPLPALVQQGIPINKAYLVSCTNSRASDIAAAAAVLRDRKVAEGVEFYIAAASSLVQDDAESSGDWQTLVNAGAKPLPAGCGPCIGLGVGLLEKGEVGISATNRNYKGRMGHPEATAYLASPAVVAASAATGLICGPHPYDSATPEQGIPRPLFDICFPPMAAESSSSPTEAALLGFPTRFEGPLVFVPQDNLTTDGMYPGKYTYQDDITLEQQADIVMQNYDPSFASMAKSIRATDAEQGSGTILVSGLNFGTGSSREQAATAIKSAGIPLVICESFGDIFKRNSINNGLILVECPELVTDLTSRFAKGSQRGSGGLEGELTVVPSGWRVSVNAAAGVVTVSMGEEGERTYRAAKVGRSVQDIWLHDGLEGFIRASL